jgi:hypothetical protein
MCFAGMVLESKSKTGEHDSGFSACLGARLQGRQNTGSVVSRFAEVGGTQYGQKRSA